MTPRRIVTLGLLAALLVGCGRRDGTPAVRPERFDVLIVNGTVYDGSLAAGRAANVGVVGERIVTVDAAPDAAAKVLIDAAGMVVVPGFIDPHTHALEDLLDPERHANLNYLTQGVTTVFVGNDGRGFPDRARLAGPMLERGIGTNVAFFAGHGTVREAVMGLENRAPTDEELQQMRELVAAEMRAGAIGLSTGLFYRPGSYAETGEVIELAKVAARYGGVYDSHIRDEASYSIGLLGAVREVLQIGEEADIPVHFAHLKALGRDVWGQSGDIIGLVAAARQRGLAVSADQYPWHASGTSFSSSLIPRWVMADSDEAMLARLANPDLADRIRREMEANLWRRGGSGSLLVTGDGDWHGKTLQEIAEALGTDPVSAALEVIRQGDVSIASFNMNPDDVAALAIQPWVMTGSDGSEGHPRKYASYPKAYRDFVRDGALMSLERFVHRSAGLPADTFALCDRGYLETGRRADIAVIDLQSFEPRADFENPAVLSTGVRWLLVNGRLAIENSEFTGAMAGDLLDRQNLDCNE